MRLLLFLFALNSLLSAGTVTNSIGMKLAPISPGSFTMGQDGPAADYNVKKHAEKFDDADWDERPAHRVTISQSFQISVNEVTLGQYRHFNPKHRGQNDDDAVTEVSWKDAVAFCEWLSKKEGKTYRLPTEAEWEFACRAGTTTLFHTGDALPAGFHSWPTDTGVRDRFFPDDKLPPEFQPKATKLSLKVGRTPANAWGLFDMHGNVAEWCADWYGPYEATEQTDPLGRVDGDFRVIRGGSHSVQTRLLRSANRMSWVSEAVNERIGFRVVLGEWPKGEKLPLPKPALHAQNVSQGVVKYDHPGPNEPPFFEGPKPFVKVEPNSFGPTFSGHNHSPAIAECPNGDLFAVWYSCVDEAGTELNNLASRLRLGASEWEAASLFWDAADVNDHAPKLWWDGDKTLFHLVRGLRENIVRHSTDNGVTWSKPQIIQPWSEIGNQLMRTRDGTILMTQDTTTTSLTRSTDGGKTWTSETITDKKLAHRNGSAARHAGIHAPIVELNDGRLMSFGRLNSESEQKAFNFKTPASFSSDGGKTWTHEPTKFPAISSVQRQVLIRLREGLLLFCSFTDLSANARKPNGMTFQSQNGDFNGAGLFAAISFDEGKTWPHKRLVTPGGKERTLNGIDRNMFPLSDTRAEHNGYLAAIQTRDGRIQLISSRNHYVFNLAWLKALPVAP